MFEVYYVNPLIQFPRQNLECVVCLRSFFSLHSVVAAPAALKLKFDNIQHKVFFSLFKLPSRTSVHPSFFILLFFPAMS